MYLFPSIILSILSCFLVGYLFWFVGHLITKFIKLEEENNLLAQLINIAFGASGFLIVVNFISNVIKDFNWGLVITFALITSLIIWQRKEFLQGCLTLKELFISQGLLRIVKQNTDKYFWILLGIINLIYGLTAFSTTKLDRFGLPAGHVFNINQLLAGTYPPRYSFLPNLPQKFHYGSDILGALVSKLSFLHPEISLDILTLVFLNLSFLTIYALTIKFLNTSPINKYLVPFAAFLAWGPITNLFTKNPQEEIPQKFLEKVNYLVQTRLIDAASWSGAPINWFFDPPSGFGVFFLLIALYLVYRFRFFESEKNLKYALVLGIFISSFVILDLLKFILLFTGLIILLLFFTPLPFVDEVDESNSSTTSNKIQDNFQKSFVILMGLTMLSAIVLGFVHQNWFALNKDYLSLLQFYKLGATNLESKFSPLQANTFLLLVYSYGFYLAYKSKQNWSYFLTTFFVLSFVIPYFLTIPNAGIGKIAMSGNVLGAFALPLVVDSAQKYFDLKENKLIAFYILLCIIFSTSSIAFWLLGDKTKPVFRLSDSSLKFTGLQAFPYSEQKEELDVIKSLKLEIIKDKSIVTEPQYTEVISTLTGLFNTFPPNTILDNPVKKEALSQYCTEYFDTCYPNSFSLDNKTWKAQRIHWFYMTPKIFRFYLLPQGRKILLNAYLQKGLKVVYSNKKYDKPLLLKELYQIDPSTLFLEPTKKYSKLLKQFLKISENKKNDEIPWYVKQSALCPYLGIYNAMSNDFDGDRIADIAFFDPLNKKWIIIYGKNGTETTIDLSKNILANYSGSDLLVPYPSDFDGDLKTDIVLFNRTSGNWRILRSSNSEVDFDKRWGGGPGEIPLPADLDGDSKTDFSAYTSLLSPHNYARWPSLLSTTGYGFRDYNLSTATLLDINVYSDVDGDKKADYVIFRSNESTFYVYLSSRNFDQSMPLKLSLGSNNSIVVPEDYDGDGKIDLAAWTPETGKWEIAYSKNLLSLSTISGAQSTYTLGQVGDTPIPGDYNGDGRADIAVYHLDSSELEIIYTNGTRRVVNLSRYKKLVPAFFIGV